MTLEYFAHNWVSEFSESHNWRTAISAGEQSVAEQRIQLVERPYRSFRVRWTECGRGEAQGLRYNFHRMSDGRWDLPLYPDVQILPNLVGFINTIPNVDTTQHRHYAGHRVLVVDKRTGEFWVRTILSIGTPGPNATLNLDASLGTSNLSEGSYLYPLVECQPLIQPPTLNWVTSEIVDVELECNEVVGPGAMPSTNNSGFPGGPGGVQDKPDVIGSAQPIFPVYDLANGVNWRSGVEGGISRRGQSFPQGRDVLYDLRGDRALESFSHPMTVCESRSDVFQLLSWHDDRKGRTRGFWFPSPYNAFDVVSVAANQIVVKAWSTNQASLDNFNDFVDFIALVGTNNDTVMAGNAGAVLFGDEWTISFSSAVILPSPILYVTTGHFVRFETDTLNIRWIVAEGTAEVGPLTMVEVTKDQPVQLGTFP